MQTTRTKAKAAKITFSVIWRSTLMWTIVSTLSVPYNITAITLLVLPVKVRHKVITSWAYTFMFFNRLICRVTYSVKGLENIPQEPIIIASNHQSTWETIAFATIFPQHVWILKRELLLFPFFGWTVSTLSPIAINRSKGSAAIQQIIAQGQERIKSGLCILAFPEGTRVAPGVRKPFKIGVARMAKAMNLPILPVAHNAGYRLPRASFWMRPGNVEVIIDKLIYPEENEAPEHLLKRIEQTITTNLATITHQG